MIDATGLSVTPVLVDMHTHLHPGGTFWCIEPDPVTWYTGVTTWIDAGSVGGYGPTALLKARSNCRVRRGMLLHIAAQGLAATVMAKLMAVGMSLDRLITTPTTSPAHALGLAPGRSLPEPPPTSRFSKWQTSTGQEGVLPEVLDGADAAAEGTSFPCQPGKTHADSRGHCLHHFAC